ncbi:beta-glucosidase [Pedobacter sp. HMF7647]|uniref:Beta-glucosidase n=1 Tax=Hufsiella arboris TaxID=2695275 RepID=A0A7K1YFY1_9SPHI|nr:glucoamylase family protein [Hufsiella arboris]MXV53048.1 beta-glucosidase [Hufsiella arboris]
MLSNCKIVLLFFFLLLLSCKKSGDNGAVKPDPVPESFSFNSLKVNGNFNGFNYYGINTKPVVKLSFSKALDKNSVSGNISLKDAAGNSVTYSSSFEDNDATIVIQPADNLLFLTKYNLFVSNGLTAADKGKLQTAITVNLQTAIDSTDKFPVISDDELLTLVQKQTFKYFWDFGHPVSGLARERNTSGDIVTSGGSGFGIMAIVTAINRNFISRADGLARLTTMVNFLTDKAQKFHGAFPHWINGATGAVQPFSEKDNGADLVETSYLMEGLLVARQYFNGSDTQEAALRAKINALWNGVEWSWFRKNNENTLYWHWSPNFNWDMNMSVKGWNEALITYILGASSATYAISKEVYDNGWAQNGAMKNGNSYFGIQLPLGPPQGGPLFFEHYSFLAVNPNGLSDQYADYQQQTVNHAKINYQYCVTNPAGNYGYSNSCWGLTASDIPNGYSASAPGNDLGVIAPTAAISSLPYTPEESMTTLRFFYYKLGDKLWGDYGFYDAFSLKEPWFASSYLAIDQGPIICMIENYRSKLLWNLFMSCPEVKTGMKNLGFQSPNL